MKSDHLAIGSSGHRKSQQLAISNWQLAKFVWKMLAATLCEIFDESAYQRFLERTSSPRSKKSYCDFMRERESMATTKPRCC